MALASKKIVNTVRDEEAHRRLDNHENRINGLENIAETVTAIGDTVEKILKYIKFAGPSIIAAAVSAGLVNGKLGAFFNALLTGIAH